MTIKLIYLSHEICQQHWVIAELEETQGEEKVKISCCVAPVASSYGNHWLLPMLPEAHCLHLFASKNIEQRTHFGA